MIMDNLPQLRAAISTGPREDDDGDFVGTPCGGCQAPIADGAHIAKYRRAWWHVGCAEQDINSGNVKAAWLALGHDLARSPRSYRTRETRMIVGALLGMIHDPDLYDEEEVRP